MAKKLKRAGPKRSSTAVERAVVYRGIKILPIYGRRSATAKALRDASMHCRLNPDVAGRAPAVRSEGLRGDRRKAQADTRIFRPRGLGLRNSLNLLEAVQAAGFLVGASTGKNSDLTR